MSMSDTGSLKYSNIEMHGINKIEIKNLNNGGLEIGLLLESERVGIIKLNEHQVKSTILMINGNVNTVNIPGNLYSLGNCSLTKLKGSIFLGKGILRGLDDKDIDFVQRVTEISVKCRIEEIEDQRGNSIIIFGNLKSIKYIQDKKCECVPVNVCVKGDIKRGVIIGKMFGGIKNDNILSIKDFNTDFIYMKPIRLGVVYVERECNYMLYVKECEITYSDRKILEKTLNYMQLNMGKADLLDTGDSNKVAWINRNYESDRIHGFGQECNIFHVLEYRYLKTNSYDGFFYRNNIAFRVIIDKKELMESIISINNKNLSDKDKEKLIDMFIYRINCEIYDRYVVGRAKGKEYKYYNESKLNGYMFSLDFFKQ